MINKNINTHVLKLVELETTPKLQATCQCYKQKQCTAAKCNSDSTLMSKTQM